MTKEDRKKMIDKIVGLLALADSTNHIEEADTARNKAAELMAKYSIEFTDIKPDDKIEYQQIDYIDINPSKAELILENAIGKFNGVLVIIVSKLDKSKYIRLVGSKENIDAHRYMIDLVKSQRDLSFNTFKANKWVVDEPVTSKEKNAWFIGYSLGVNNKVYDLINAGKQKQQEWGLVVIDPVKAAEDWYRESHSLMIRKNRASAFSEAGLNSGRNVNLNRGLSFGNGSTLLIGC